MELGGRFIMNVMPMAILRVIPITFLRQRLSDIRLTSPEAPVSKQLAALSTRLAMHIMTAQLPLPDIIVMLNEKM